MKTQRFFYAVLLLLSAIFNSSCDSFLDRQEDEALTFDKIWETRINSRAYWLTTLSFIPSDADRFNYDPWLCASDEGCGTFNFGGRAWNEINSGSWNPSNMAYANDCKNNFYKGIRECNQFLANIDKCNDPLLQEKEREMWKAQTRFARAYYYFLMMRNYGPVFLIGDEVIDFMASAAELERPRNTWEECVNYVVGEMTELCKNVYLTDTWVGTADKGLATKGVCRAVISRLTLYAARDLFNGNTLYAEVKNPDGTSLFPQTYEPTKWKVAAEAAKAVIDMGTYSLYKAESNDPYDNYYGITQKFWNSELIYSMYKGRWMIASHITPSGAGGGSNWGHIGVTQQQVDAYAMNNGVYPIKGYNNDGTPVVDSESGYPSSQEELVLDKMRFPSCFGVPAYDLTVPKMYANREPRFYVTVYFSGSKWINGNKGLVCSFAKGGNCNVSDSHPRSGYMMNRLYDHSVDPVTMGAGSITYPIFRLGEIYLNFIESVLECEKRGVTLAPEYKPLAMKCWSELRDRVGLPAITDVYKGADINQLIELCRAERRVELAFENHRFFDTRTWMIAEKTDGGKMWGMNINAPGSGEVIPADFWKRTVFQTRVFEKKHYLFPFEQRDLDLNKQLKQNYGW